ncbi:MAG: hypothetical protein QGG26_04520 [Candidatus Undinarchaeales archaeon]|nr:hypothetical protein [Candidatus Undinarchaeales archaeon]
MVFNWERVLADVEIAAIKTLGKDEAEGIFYRTGKELGLRYMYFGGRAVPSFLAPRVVRYLFSTWKTTGFTIAENLEFDPVDKRLVLNGDDNYICRFSGGGSLFAGFAAGILTYIYGIEFEGVITKCSGRGDDGCELISQPRENGGMSYTYTVDVEDIKPVKGYDGRNFISTTSKERIPSITDLIKQKKVVHDKETSRFSLGGECIIPIEVGFTGMLLKNIEEQGAEFDVRMEIVDSARAIGKDQFPPRVPESTNLVKLRSILSSFGYGLPFISVKKDRVVIDLLNPPYSGFGFQWNILVIQGLLSSILDSSLNLEEVKEKRSSTVLHFSR